MKTALVAGRVSVTIMNMLYRYGGADVYDRYLAVGFRSMEKETPKMIRIVRPRRAPKDGVAKQPYFGVKLTAAGRRFVEARLARRSMKIVEPRCEKCGCTEWNACITPYGTCAWVRRPTKKREGLCTACIKER